MDNETKTQYMEGSEWRAGGRGDDMGRRDGDVEKARIVCSALFNCVSRSNNILCGVVRYGTPRTTYGEERASTHSERRS